MKESTSCKHSVNKPAIPYSDLSVVIPTQKRSSLILKLAESLSTAMASANVQVPVIVISDTQEVRHFCGLASFREYRRPELFSAASKRNYGWQQAQAEWIAFIDDDCQVVPEFFTLLKRHLLDIDDSVGALYGVTEFSGQKNLAFRVLENTDYLADFAWARTRSALPWAPTSVAVVRRVALVEIGGFDETFDTCGGEDVDLGIRLRDKGWVLRGCPDVFVWHTTSTWNTVALNVRRFFRYGTGNCELQRKHPHLVAIKIDSLASQLLLLAPLLFWHIPTSGRASVQVLFAFAGIIALYASHLAYLLFVEKRHLFQAMILAIYDYSFEFGVISRALFGLNPKAMWGNFHGNDSYVYRGLSAWLSDTSLYVLSAIVIVYGLRLFVDIAL